MSLIISKSRRSLAWLVGIILALYALLAGGVFWGNATVTPGLALDLAGGRQIIMIAQVDGDEEFTQADLQQAVEVIRRRIDASGVAEAEISTQGTDTILVGLPGNPSDATIDLIRQSAQLQFRPVLLVGSPLPVDSTAVEPDTTPDPGPDQTAGPTPGSDTPDEDPATTDDSATEEEATPEPQPAPEETPSEGNNVTPDRATTDPSSDAWLTDDLLEVFTTLDCTLPANRSGAPMGDPDAGHVACAQDGTAKYVLGPVELTGAELSRATSGPELGQMGTPTGRFAVNITFTGEGAAAFDRIASRLFDFPSTDDRNRFAMVLDGAVISAPGVNSRSFGGTAQITGNFDQVSAETLANQLQFGAIPVTLVLQTNDQIAATLGQDQLQKGLIAGAIGLALVFLYALVQYRVLGLVTVASLTLAGVTTFVLISLLSWGMDYRLSLAGVAGLIVAIGITADSFIVYFERIRDELRDGRSLTSAVDHAWTRARRTILASDAISLVAAVTLYMLAVGGVRGFAFTLGLITIVDVFIVFLFTHPLMTLLARTSFFASGHRLSGLDPRQLGREALYKGRGRVKSTAVSSDGLTLAERKAAQRVAKEVQS